MIIMLTLGMCKCEYTITYRVSQSITTFDVIQHIYIVLYIVYKMHVHMYIYIYICHIHIQDHFPWYQHIYLYITTDNKGYHLIIGYMTNKFRVFGSTVASWPGADFSGCTWRHLCDFMLTRWGRPWRGAAPGFRSPQTWLGWEVSPIQGGKIMGKLVYFFCKWRFIAGKGNELCEWRQRESERARERDREREREKCGIFQQAMFDDAGRVAGCSSR